jgi:O-antigen/teichoic acid export membrane protein
MGTLSGGLAKACSALTMVAAVAATSRYLNVQRFGLWMTLVSMTALLSFADFGLGSSLVNAVSNARGDGRAIQTAVTNSLLSLGTVTLGLGLLAWLTLHGVDWARFFNLTDATARAEAPAAVAIFIAILLLNNLLSLIQKLQWGLQLAWQAGLWASGGQLLALLGVLYAAHRKAGLVWLMAALGGGPLLAWLINSLHFFARAYPHYRPRWGLAQRRQCLQLGLAGTLFMWLEGMALIGNASDNVIIAHLLGAAAVASYAVAQKLVAALSLSQLLSTPLWPAFGDALAHGDHAWAQRLLRRILLLALLWGAFSALIIRGLGPWIIRVWAGPSLVPSAAVLDGFAAAAIMLALVAPLSAFLNTSEHLRRQSVYYPVASVAAVALMIGLTDWYRNAAGAIWGKVIAYTVLFLIPGIWLTRQVGAPVTEVEETAVP